MVNCLRSVDVSRFLANSTLINVAAAIDAVEIAVTYWKISPVLGLIEYFLPHVENVIDGQFYDLLANGTLPHPVPTMFAQVQEEAGLLVNSIIPNIGPSGVLDFLGLALTVSPSAALDLAAHGGFDPNTTEQDGVRDFLTEVFTAVSRSTNTRQYMTDVGQREWLCPQEYLLDRHHSIFLAVYQALLTDGHQLSTVYMGSAPMPERCLQQGYSCHGSDLHTFGTLNYATKNVQPYFSKDDVEYSQLMDDIWSAFIKTHDPNPSKAYLELRGSSYNDTKSVFEGFSLRKYVSSDDTNYLGYKGHIGHN